MGGAQSSRSETPETAKIKSLESRLASLGHLPYLEIVFSHLTAASPSTRTGAISPPALQECFKLQSQFTGCIASSDLSRLVGNVGSALVEFIYEPENNAIDWSRFLKGFDKCCQLAAFAKLKLLLLYFHHIRRKADLPICYTFSDDVNEISGHNEIAGHITLAQLQDFLWIYWIMGHDSNKVVDEDLPLELPNVESLVKAAYLASTDEKQQLKKESGLWDMEVPAGKLFSWMLLSIPGLSDSLFQYVQARLRRAASKFQNLSAAKSDDEGCHTVDEDLGRSIDGVVEKGLLTASVAWAIGLSQPNVIGCNLLSCSFSSNDKSLCLLYRSSLHGWGMNRFWAHVEGYQGTVLLLIHGISLQNAEESMETDPADETWLLGAIVSDGFENKFSYYGSTGCCLFALDPVMQPFRCTGRGSNYVYSHAHVANTFHNAQLLQRPDGIGFGGENGKERLWINDDFSQLIVRHHAVDKTYQPGLLLPQQESMMVKGKVLKMEAWGLGGKVAKEQQENFQQRENLFSAQKRKVDLKAFGNWSDSPEKMMMGLVSDPNKVQREER